MKIAISGKGGTGKTTISGTLARLAARKGYSTLAIDCDSNPNLGVSLGLSFPVLDALVPLPKTVAGVDIDAETLIAKHGIEGPDGVTMVVATRVEKAGGG